MAEYSLIIQNPTVGSIWVLLLLLLLFLLVIIIIRVRIGVRIGITGWDVIQYAGQGNSVGAGVA